jgi:hypothetical protein
LANNDMPSITSGTSICAQATLLVANNIVPSAADVKYVAVRFIAFLLIDLVLQKFEMQQALVINLRVRLSLLVWATFAIGLMASAAPTSKKTRR